MVLEQFLSRARALEKIEFSELMALIEQCYEVSPSAFSNGLEEARVVNGADQNQGSCKLLAFAKLHGLDQQQTLNLFGDFYHQEVLGDPEGSSHANIRAFMACGWDGVDFEGPVLSLKAQ